MSQDLVKKLNETKIGEATPRKMTKAQAVEEIVAAVIESYDSEAIADLLKEGFRGYEKFSNEELEEELLGLFREEIKVTE